MLHPPASIFCPSIRFRTEHASHTFPDPPCSNMVIAHVALFMLQVNKRLEEGAIGVADIEVKVRRILYCYDDANRLSAARAEVEELGVPALLEGL